MSLVFYGAMLATPGIAYGATLVYPRWFNSGIRVVAAAIILAASCTVSIVTLVLLNRDITATNNAIDALAASLDRMEAQTLHCFNSAITSLTRHGEIGGLPLALRTRPALRLFRTVILGSCGAYAMTSMVLLVLGAYTRQPSVMMTGVMVLYLFSISALGLLVYADVFSAKNMLSVS